MKDIKSKTDDYKIYHKRKERMTRGELLIGGFYKLKHPSFSFKNGQLSKRRNIGNSLSKYGYKQGHNRLSFVIGLKVGECLDVSINAKRGEC